MNDKKAMIEEILNPVADALEKTLDGMSGGDARFILLCTIGGMCGCVGNMAKEDGIRFLGQAITALDEGAEVPFGGISTSQAKH